MQVCHRCDVRLCCNPAHLFLGTAADNQYDKGAKGRAAKGERNGGGGKLTEDDVRVVRAMRQEGATLTAIGQQFGVSGTMIGFIVRGEQWTHVV